MRCVPVSPTPAACHHSSCDFGPPQLALWTPRAGRRAPTRSCCVSPEAPEGLGPWASGLDAELP
eukprot:12474267-Alexandrium_andersonii.AAC.1